MSFARKTFIAVFLSTLALGSLMVYLAFGYSYDRIETDFTSRYQTYTKVLADTLTRLDTSTEALMLTAAKVIVEKDLQKGLLSTSELQALQSELGVTHLFITDKNGKFVRSTNDDPAKIPNLFSFCPKYKELIVGNHKVEATPIIKPNPEPKPFKFLSVPNHSKTRIIEVGVRVDFIAKTLAEAIKSDDGVKVMSLYAPDGTPFGKFTSDNVAFESQKAELPSQFNEPIVTDDFVKFYTKVLSSHPKCCQCDASGTSKNGEYYYVLETTVSKDNLKAAQASAGIIFLLIGLGNLLLSYLLARFVARRLVKNIEAAATKVRNIKNKNNATEASGAGLKQQAGDEITFISEEFDRLIATLEESKGKLEEAEKIKSKVEAAKLLAHNMKSSVTTIEMMIPGLVAIPASTKKILKKSAEEIKELSDKLRDHSDSMAAGSKTAPSSGLVFLPMFLDDLIKQKTLEFSKKENSVLKFNQPHKVDGLFTKANGLELKSVLSNIINNASEAYGPTGGVIEVSLNDGLHASEIRIVDHGAGIPSEYLKDLGFKSISFKGTGNRGLGLTHAFNYVASLDGEIKINSEMGVGTEVVIRLPKYVSDKVDECAAELEGAI